MTVSESDGSTGVDGDLVGGLAGLVEELSGLALAVGGEGLVGVDGVGLKAVLDGLEQAHCAVSAARSAVLAVCEEQRVHRGDGVRSPSPWLADRHRLPRGVAAGRVCLARGLGHTPEVFEALARGEITEAHARVLVGVWSPEVGSLFRRDVEILLGAARDCSFRGFEETVRRWLAFADPDRSDGRDARARKKRALYRSRSGDRMYIDVNADLLSGAVIDNVLAHFEDRLFDEDWKATRQVYGEAACGELMDRSPAQRRLDALVEALRIAYEHDTAGAGDPLVHVVVDRDTLDREIRRFCGMDPDPTDVFNPQGRCSLIDGTPISPAQALYAAFEGHMARVVYDTAGRIIDMGRKTRFFTGALKEALIIRDRICSHPRCEIPATRCEADHRIPWVAGGVTSLANGQMLCWWHHRHKHHPSP